MIGVAAGRFHTVLWTREAVYTMGLNGGQLGNLNIPKYKDSVNVSICYVCIGNLIYEHNIL